MNKNLGTVALAIAAASLTANATELTSNGGFEAGDLSGWADFTGTADPGFPGTFNISTDPNTGSFAGEVFNNQLASSAVVKQANLGIGLVQPGDEIEISFAAKGDFLIGGVLVAEFFSELDGGGVSSAEILGGQPLFFASQAEYQTFTFTTIAGPDVSGGVTVQFAAITGGAAGSLALAFIDDVSVRIIPAPAGVAAFGLAGLAAARRRRA